MWVSEPGRVANVSVCIANANVATFVSKHEDDDYMVVC